MRRWNIRRYMKAPPGNQSRSGDAGQEWPTRLGRHRPEKWIDGHADHKRGTTADRALPAGQTLDALRAVEYELPSFDTELQDVDLAEVARASRVRHVRGASDATYLINAFGEELLMQLQLNGRPGQPRVSEEVSAEHACAGDGALRNLADHAAARTALTSLSDGN
jgi:hypothetical protein